MTTDGIKQLIADLLRHMRIACDAIETAEADGRERFSVRTPDSHLLIGAKGAHLLAFNHVVKKMAAAKGEREKSFFIDVNGYQEAANETIKNVARVMGERARSFRTNVELEPMSSYERMVVHSFLQDAQDLKTESVGEGERRRVVIKYVEPQNM